MAMNFDKSVFLLNSKASIIEPRLFISSLDRFLISGLASYFQRLLGAIDILHHAGGYVDFCAKL